MSSSLPSPNDDYTAPERMALNEAAWNAALNSIGARIRALEAVKADFNALIALGTGQALAVIQANVAPQLAALDETILALSAAASAAEDRVATLLAGGGVAIGNVVGLETTLASKATPADISAAINALKGSAPALYDTLGEIAAKLADEDDVVAGLVTTIAGKLAISDFTGAAILAKLLLVDGSGSGLDADTVRGVTPGAYGLALLGKASNDLVPAGAVCYFAMSSPPPGWLKMNGALISRTAYATLFAAIGTYWGAGDGSTTFALPDLRGEFLRGWDDGRGADPGRTFGWWQDSDNRSHGHMIWGDGRSDNGGGGRLPSVGQESLESWVWTENSGGTEARPRNVALLACIKY